MKIMNIVLLIAVLAFISSCVKRDDLNLDNDTPCMNDYDDHMYATTLQSLIDEYTQSGFIGLTVLVDDPKDGTWIGSSGYAEIEDDTKMHPCHLHYAASIYKTFIATIILQLEEENKLSLNTKLAEYLPSTIIDRLPNGDQISIKNLLQQRTGIPDIFEVEFIMDFFNNQTKQYTIEELLEYVYDKEPLSEVDTEFYYSDANYSLLTLVIDKIEGDYIKVIEDRIFKSLQLKDTYFLQEESVLPTGIASSYWDRYGNGKIENNSLVQLALITGLKGSDGLLTSALDLKIFIKALAKGELVTNVEQMTEFLPLPDEAQNSVTYSGYGMGLMKVQINEEKWYGHFGNHVGSGAIMLYNEEENITFVAYTNTGTFFSDKIKTQFFFHLIDDIETILLK